MANLVETSVWEAGIYQLETSDPVQGGVNGIDNRAPRQLANRTLWLKNQIAAAVQSIGTNKTSADTAINLRALAATTITAGAGLTGGGSLAANRSIALATPSTLSGSTTNWVGNGATGHTHELAAATATVAGVSKLINNLTSTDTASALSAAQGKVLNEGKVSKSGDTMTGVLNISRNAWEKMRFTNSDGSFWRWESAPPSTSEVGNRFNYVFTQQVNGVSTEIGRIAFGAATGDEKVAYQSWVSKNYLKTQELSDSDNLDNIVSPGFFYQQANIRATTELNYPVARAGTLKVMQSATGVMQIYTDYDNATQYFRRKYNNTWGAWKTLNADASTTAKGLVQLDSSVNSAAENKAATPKAVKAAYDLANRAVKKDEYNIVSYKSDYVNFSLNNPTNQKIMGYLLLANNVPKGSIEVAGVGSGRYETRITSTPAGAETGDRRVVAMTVRDDYIHTAAYGVLHEGFVRSGTGVGQHYGHQIVIGWDNVSRLKATIDSGDLGNFVFDSHFANALNTNGYQKLPNGLILQWGCVTGNIDTYISVTFPISFPNSCLGVQATPVFNSVIGGGSVLSSHVGSISKIGCSVAVNDNNVGSQNIPIYWFAIGN